MVVDVKPIADLHTVPVDRQRLIFNGVGDHQRDQLLGKLVRPVVVRAVRDDGRQTVRVEVRPDQVVRRGLRRRVGRQQISLDALDLRQLGMIAIDRTARGVNKRAHLLIARREQHVERAVDVRVVAVQRLGNRARYRPERALMQHVVHAGAGFVAEVADAQVALKEAEAFPLAGGDEVLELVEVLAVAGGEVVEAHHSLVEFEEVFDEVGADEAGSPGDEPGARGFLQLGAEGFVGGHGVTFYALRVTRLGGSKRNA